MQLMMYTLALELTLKLFRLSDTFDNNMPLISPHSPIQLKLRRIMQMWDKHFFETYFKENCSTQEVVGMNDIIEDMPSITLKEAQIGNLKKNLVQDTACEASEEGIKYICVGVYVCVGTPTNFIWTREATKYFLQKYAERKNAFQNPKIKKKTIWEEIQKDLTSVGYNIYTEILDRKMRNMKHSFKTIKDNNKKSSTGHGRIQ
ncbi:uncharacterized protein LOC105830042 isoform X3 [Monomorium pharaonis]|uniref:uncharacterized protein LOC105830042 isoform X3 n=1 Tax=Monomorium pharaonis TaxID=307658 RepID=UPI0017471C05|nr:uncharacterized protein LOC105830042 isoform X3 [Monomorium pharaonis]